MSVDSQKATLALSADMAPWLLTALREKSIKIDARAGMPCAGSGNNFPSAAIRCTILGYQEEPYKKPRLKKRSAIILVTGANGTTGSEVVRQLAAEGRPVRAMVRKPENAEPFPKERVEVVVASFSDIDSLDSAMNGVDAVFMISFEHPDHLALQANVIEAAKRAGVKMVVRLSGVGAGGNSGDPLVSNHGKGDRQLARSGLGYVLIRPQWFNQNFLTYCSGGVISLPAGNAPLPFVDVRDIAAVTIEALTEPSHEGQAYNLTGPEALNHTEVAAILSEATGKHFVYEDVSPETYRRGLIGEGASEHYADLITNVFAFVRSRGEDEVHDDIERVLGRPAISFRRFAHDYADKLARQMD